jgi:tetratricopeptide (TPR) repeat protein
MAMNRAQRRAEIAPTRRGEAAHRAGLKAAQSGDWPTALSELGRAVRQAPDRALYWNNLAAAQSQAGEAGKAVASAKRALALEPLYREARFNLATALKQLGALGEAASLFHELLAEHDDDLDSWINLAFCQQNLNAPEIAEGVYRGALARFPGEPMLVGNLGGLLCTLRRYGEAEDLLAGADAPAHFGIAYNHGLACYHLGKLTEARTLMEKAVRLDPGAANAHASLSAILLLLGEPRAALVAAEHAYELAPEHHAIRNNLAAALDENDRSQEAMEIAESVLAEDPSNAGALVNAAILLRRQRDWESVKKHLMAAIAVAPEDPAPHFYLCGTYFLLGDWRNAWEEFEYRWMKTGERPRAAFSRPRWQGEDLRDKTILLWGEQGIGDELMFAGFIPDLSAGHLILECQDRLVPLFRRSFPQAVVRPHPQDSQGIALDRSHETDFDYEAAFGDLGRYFRPTLAHFTKRDKYLSVDSIHVRILRDRYRLLADGRPIVGVSWRSGNRQSGGRRSAPLSLWHPIFVRNCFFVSLQYGDQEEASGYPIYRDISIDPLLDMDAFAAQVAAMDMVVSIDNTTVHMAGALGIPTMALLSFHADVRWTATEDSSPFYPSVRLLRQTEAGAWHPVMAQAACALDRLGARRESAARASVPAPAAPKRDR